MRAETGEMLSDLEELVLQIYEEHETGLQEARDANAKLRTELEADAHVASRRVLPLSIDIEALMGAQYAALFRDRLSASLRRCPPRRTNRLTSLSRAGMTPRRTRHRISRPRARARRSRRGARGALREEAIARELAHEGEAVDPHVPVSYTHLTLPTIYSV